MDPAIFRRALGKVFVAMKQVMGDIGEKQVRVSVVGGMYMQEHKFRSTKDADVCMSLPSGMSSVQLRDAMVRTNKEFTKNFEKISGVTWRDPVTRTIVPIDLVPGAEIGYSPKGKLLAEVADDEVPYAEAHEVIKMKIIAGPRREDILKGVRDWDDVRDLINSGVELQYTAEEKKDCRAAFDQFFETYLEMEAAWTREEWLEKTNLAR